MTTRKPSHPAKRDGLTARQQLFVTEYAIDHNGAQAAIRAGFSKKGARVAASKLLAKGNIRAAIANLDGVRLAKADVTAQKVMDELARVAFSDMRRYAKWGSGGVTLNKAEDLSEDDARCVSEVSQTITAGGGSIKFKLHDKVTALTLLGKHLGMFPERLAIEDPATQSDEALAKRRAALRRKLNLGE